MKNFSLKMNWISIVMLLSLGVNFFVIGYFYAQHTAKEIRMTRLSFDNSISKLVEPFPRKGKHDFYVTMRSKREDLIPIYRNIMAQRATIMNIIAEEQLDADKLRKAMQDYHEIYHNMVNPTQEVVIKIVSGLNFEERKAILERFKNPPKKNYRDRNTSDDRSRRSNDNNDRNRR
tara:strand:- start:234259 stop:234783 length:525 start_codon:yes stop_codon:yes gene_type:complete